MGLLNLRGKQQRKVCNNVDGGGIVWTQKRASPDYFAGKVHEGMEGKKEIERTGVPTKHVTL